jgi:predicted nucleic acid-binding protein
VEVAAPYLVDKSALARLPIPAVSEILTPLWLARRIATCGIIDLEMLYSARNHTEMTSLRLERKALVQIPMLPADYERAMDVMALLSRTGQHRSARIPDLLVAATAERSGLSILHYNQDFDRIAAVTGQPTAWIVPRGSV